MRSYLLLLAGLFLFTNPGYSQSETDISQQHISGGDDSINFPVNERSNIIEYPFGYSQPILKCAQLRFSRVVLQEGETINNIVIGDKARWQVTKSWQGKTGATKPIILVKPRSDNAETNLLIFTSKRTYDITLIAEDIPEGETNPDEFFTRAITFYYPNEESVEGDETLLPSQQEVPANSQAGNVEDSSGADSLSNDSSRKEVDYDNGEISLKDANLNYETEKGKHGFPWEPEMIYDNGKHVFIKLPNEADHGPMPSFYIVNDAGERENVNIAYNPDTEILKVDRIFDRAVLQREFKHSGFLGIGSVSSNKELFIIRK